MSTFSCQYKNYRGNLVVTEKEFYFTSSLFRIDLEWSNVKRVRLETQQVKGVPTSVLVVVLQHNEAIRMQATQSSSLRKRGSASRKYFFYGFQDLLGAEEMVKHYLEKYRAAEKAREKEGREETDKDSLATTKRPEKATEKDDVSSSDTDALKEDSLNLSRTLVPRRSDSEPSRVLTPAPVGGRRATTSASRPKIPAKLLTAAVPPTAATAEQRSRFAVVFLRGYRHVAVLLVLVMLFLLGRYFARTAAVNDGRHATQSAEKLLRDIDALAGVTAELETYDNQESLWRYNKGRKRLAQLSHTYTQHLEETSVELMERYVAIQATLTTLRGQRAARVAREQQSGVTAPPPPPTMSSEFSTPKRAATGVRVAATHRGAAASTSSSATAAAGGSAMRKDDVCADGTSCKKTASQTKAAASAIQRKRKTSLSRLQSDIQRWVRRGRAAWAFVARLLSAARADSPPLQPSSSSVPPSSDKGTSSDELWVIYSEELGDTFHLTEWVAAAEDEDRRQCLRLTKDLLDTVDLTERVFVAFASVFLAGPYRQLVSGEERGSYWLQPPQALRTITNGLKSAEKKAFSGDAMARMAMLRRFVASLVHDEPLVSNQAHRRAAALQVVEALAEYRHEEVTLLRTRNRRRTDNATLLWTILSDMVLAPSTQPLRGNPAVPEAAAFLRNSVEELRFWRTHESAWREHVLTFFTPEEQADIRSSFGAGRAAGEEAERGLTDPSTQPKALRWRNLPLFRGLLCFETIPTLHEAADASTTVNEGTAREAEDGIERGEGNAVENEEGADAADVDGGDVDLHDFSGPLTKVPPPNATKVLPVPKLNTSSSSASSPSAAEVKETSAVPGTPPTTPAPGPASTASTPLAESSVLWKEVKLRWMTDLEAFRLAFDPALKPRTSRAARSYRLDVEDRSVVADAAEVRRRLFGLLAVVNEHYVRYVTPNVAQRVGSFLRKLFPPYSSSHSGESVYVSVLQTWGTQDPEVQLATAQVTGLAPGTTHDVSSSLLYLVLQPPPLLQTSMLSTRKTMAAATVLILFAVVLAVLHCMQ
ncbi:hypothetical protein ABB37_01054 [Leptomonas pyrrhocoris]|uniref:Uncharacterized protein n=1 Tax=Leptomonas pyrrhocoris TaxID=157538 RepID=A0A0M9G813_LEPPY|nr:hypothetical protein ABB37_01054 [Leptomonas pyrrhocoris]KPA84507.1 hypothetical protein ABB37_01054 [Leptomonas pyrrhocoris]|eukprot:XP_015662946.1 hypothetical protein ABB37_01054 [Leptomonas pyrrhocoris]